MASTPGTPPGTRRRARRRRLATWAAPPNFGPNVYVFSPSMPQSQIQAV